MISALSCAGETTIVCVVVPVFPSVSVALNVTAYVPAVVYRCVAVGPVAEPPSPKLQTYETIATPFGSVAPPVNATFWPTLAVESAEIVTVGGDAPACVGVPPLEVDPPDEVAVNVTVAVCVTSTESVVSWAV